MHKGGEKTGTGVKASKAMGAISKLRANNSELASALQSKKQECEDLKAENLELKDELQILNQKRIAMSNALNKCRPLLMQVALHWMNAEDSLLEFQKEFDICNSLENADANESTTMNTGDVAARAKRFRDQYSAKKEGLILAAAGDNLSVIIERSTLTDESPKRNSMPKPSGSGLQAGGSNSKVKSLLPKTNHISAKPKPVKGKKPSKVVVSSATLKAKYKQSKGKKFLTKTREKLPVVLPPEEMPAFRPTFQIPRTPSKDDGAKEVSKSPLKLDNVFCNVTRLTNPQIESRIASLPEKAASAASVRTVSFTGTEEHDDGKINTTFDKTPIPPGTLAETGKTTRRSPRSSRSSIPFSLDATTEINAEEIASIPSLDTAGPSNGVNKSPKVKKARKKAEQKKKQANGPKNVRIENPAAETENTKRVDKRKSRRNTLIEEENFNIPSPKVTPSPKKKKILDESPEKRPRRAASSVTYKEPNVNRKMRRT